MVPYKSHIADIPEGIIPDMVINADSLISAFPEDMDIDIHEEDLQYKLCCRNSVILVHRRSFAVHR